MGGHRGDVRGTRGDVIAADVIVGTGGGVIGGTGRPHGVGVWGGEMGGEGTEWGGGEPKIYGVKPPKWDPKKGTRKSMG